MSVNDKISSLKIEIKNIERYIDLLEDAIQRRRNAHHEKAKKGFFESESSYLDRIETLYRNLDISEAEDYKRIDAYKAQIKSLNAQIQKILETNNRKDF